MSVIIIDPNPHPTIVKQIVCKNCGVTLQYTPADVKQKYVKDYGGGGDTYHWIDCPKCGKEVYTQ